MPLPKIATPTYELTLHSNGQKIKYRPFLVKEEKLLHLAAESQDIKEITNSVKTVLKNCIHTRGVKVDSLPTFDIEYLFLNIRARSIGEELEVNVVCPDDGETEVPITINIDDIKVFTDEKHTKTIKLDNNLMMDMKYPSLDQFIENNFNLSEMNIEQSFKLIADCIDKIYNEEEVWTSSDTTKSELIDFLEQMNTFQFKQIEEFFSTMPKLYHVVTVINPKTKVESSIPLEGLSSFF